MQHPRVTRLFLDLDLSGDRAELRERESNYLGSVLRLRRGDPVLVFNGRGQERHATIASLARRHAELALLDHVEPLPESHLRLTLVQALPKADAMDFVVQKVTELGVHALWPVTTDYTVVRLGPDRAERRAAHWRRIAQSACEQCGRHRPPDIREVASLDDALGGLPQPSVRIVLDPRADSSLEAAERTANAVFLLVGPEGGFSSPDLERIDEHGFERMRLGPRTLRAETAAIIGAGLLQALWGDLR
ncbi:MAG TPA: 16S rRNA (uracil(1498)-N(3))-methyltransferase [Gammaproteobacteria bacterium]